MAVADKLVNLADLKVAYDDNAGKISDLKSALDAKSVTPHNATFVNDENFVLSKKMLRVENVRIDNGGTDVNLKILEFVPTQNTKYNLAHELIATSYELASLTFDHWYVVEYDSSNEIINRFNYYADYAIYPATASVHKAIIYANVTFSAPSATLTGGYFDCYGISIWTGENKLNAFKVKYSDQEPDRFIEWMTTGSQTVFSGRQLVTVPYIPTYSTSSNSNMTGNLSVGSNKQLYIICGNIYDEIKNITNKKFRLLVREYNSSNGEVKSTYSEYGDLKLKLVTSATTAYVIVFLQIGYSTLQKSGQYPISIGFLDILAGEILYDGGYVGSKVISAIGAETGNGELLHPLAKAETDTILLTGDIVYSGDYSQSKINNTMSGDIGFVILRHPVSVGETYRFAWDEITDNIVADTKSQNTYLVEYASVGGPASRYVYFGPDKEYVVKSGVAEIGLLTRVYFTNRTTPSSGQNVTLTISNLLITKGRLAINDKYLKPVYENLEAENIAPNDEFYTNGHIRRCYNPYKNSGQNILTGQLHCHSKNLVDGNIVYYAGSDEGLCLLHRNCGYDFITITNYASVGVTTKPENTHGLIWLCNSFEFSAPQSYPEFNGQHMCIYNIDNIISDVPINMTPQDVADMIHNKGMACDLAHPSWSDMYQSPAKVGRIRNRIRFCEVYDRLNEIENNVTVPAGKGTDYAWEIMLDNGCVVWATAVNDAHTGADGDNHAVSKGCVKVFAEAQTATAIWKALCNGTFIATTDTSVGLNSITFENGTLSIDTGDSGATTKFLGKNGAVLKTVNAQVAEYAMDGSEIYVRAVVTTSSGDTVWTQPIIITKRGFDNFGAILS